jgi:hypothetical protein
MGALANLYAISDWSVQQIAIGVAVLPLLVALAWYCRTRFIADGYRPAYQRMSARSVWLRNEVDL